MSTLLRTPSDVEPESIVDLVEDCRELVAAAAPRTGPVPAARAPRPAPLVITPQLARSVDGYAEYGS